MACAAAICQQKGDTHLIQLASMMFLLQLHDLSILGFMLSPSTITNVFTILTAATYVAVVFTAYKAYQTRSFLVVPVPDYLLEHYLDKLEEDTKAILTETMSSAFHQNENLVNDKAFWVTWVLRSLLAEAFLLLALTLVQLTL